nr:PIN domain-containing protein [uncultured Desulfovibrio sp.]
MDTNVLLDLYRVNKDTRDTLKDIIDSFGTRIWIPYHVAYEFLKKRNTVKNTSQQMFAAISNNIKKFESEIINSFNEQMDTSNIRLKNTSEFSKEIENFKDSISTVIKNFNEKIEKHGEDLNNDLQHHDIISWIFEKFNGHVGEPFENEAEIIEEAKQRISAGRAPGISDTNKENNKYGDYFIWRQILDYTNNTSHNVIFVTSEKKS